MDGRYCSKTQYDTHWSNLMYSHTTREHHMEHSMTQHQQTDKTHVTCAFDCFVLGVLLTLKKKQNNHSMKPTPPKQTTLLNQSVRLTNKTKTPNCFIWPSLPQQTFLHHLIIVTCQQQRILSMCTCQSEWRTFPELDCAISEKKQRQSTRQKTTPSP